MMGDGLFTSIDQYENTVRWINNYGGKYGCALLIVFTPKPCIDLMEQQNNMDVYAEGNIKSHFLFMHNHQILV